MGDIIKLPLELVDRNRRKAKIEYHIRSIERILPFFRKHLQEYFDIRTKFHKDQAEASLARIREALDYIQYYTNQYGNPGPPGNRILPRTTSRDS